MALVETLFSEYPLGVPADWTDFWGTGDIAATIESNAAGDIDFGTKWLKYETNADDRSVLTWDDLGSMSDVCAIAKIKDVVRGSFRLFLRVGGTAGNEDGYFVYPTVSVLHIYKFKAGVATSLISSNFIPITNAEYWVKFQVIGTALKAKIWRADSIEPYDWHLETTDSGIASGYVGVGSGSINHDFNVDYFGADSSEIDLPASYTDDVYFSTTSIGITLDTMIDYARAQGGYFTKPNRKLTGVRVWCEDLHNDQIRIGVYSGGSLVTGPQGATLLKDFGLTSGVGTKQWISIATGDDINIPVDEPLWIVVKGDNASGFETNYTPDAMHCGDFQVVRGATVVTGIIGKDPDVSFPSAFPAGTDTFGNNWFLIEILTEEVFFVAVDANKVECLSEITSPSIDKIQPIGANNVESLTEVTAWSIETGWLYPPDIPCDTEITVPSFSVKREIVIPGMESSSEVTAPTLKISHDLNYSDISSLTEVTAAGIYKELFPSDIECSSSVEGASAEWIMVGRMNVTLPMITAEMSGGHGGFLNVELPMITAEMRAGARLNVTLPMITAELEGKVGVKADLNVTLPMIKAEMTGTVEVLGQLNAALPMITARMTGTAGHVGQLNVTLPMITAALTGYTDIDGQLNVTLPMIEARLTGTIERAACEVLRYVEPELE